MASRYQVLLQERADLVKEGEALDAVADWGDEQTTRANEIAERIKALDPEIASMEVIREAQRNAPAGGDSPSRRTSALSSCPSSTRPASFRDAVTASPSVPVPMASRSTPSMRPVGVMGRG